MSIGSTLIGGIQDISALLPLLGTEQCEDHIASAVTRGYLYAAVTPLSIFGSLGMARAGFKAFVASCDIERWGFVGAKVLADMGFKPLGENLSLIMFDQKNQHLVETRLKDLLKELHINVATEIQVDYKSAEWRSMMIFLTALSSSVSIVPYITLDLIGGSRLNVAARWTFPALRAFGGFLIAMITPLVIQMRIVTLIRKQLANRQPVNHTSKGDNHQSPGDHEKGLDLTQQSHTAEFINSILLWFILFLLLLGILASIVGYVGCFSVVQNTKSKTGPIIWISLEAVLSIIRMAFWAVNPDCDEAPPLQLKLILDEHRLLLNCMEYDDGIMEMVLPLTPASEFLESITSFAGLVDHFDGDSNLTLYYTLMRKNVQDKPSERMLYITIFDHTERTLRIYTCDADRNIFYSTKSPLIIDLEHGILEVKCGEKLEESNDPIARNMDVLSMLKAHHQSIMNQIRYTIGSAQRNSFIIENDWTMEVGDSTESAWERQRKKSQDEWQIVLEQGKVKEISNADPLFNLDHLYLKQGQVEEKRRLLIETRGEWIEDYMQRVNRETRKIISSIQCLPLDKEKMKEVNEDENRLKGKIVNYRAIEMEVLMMWEQCLMEHLLIYEVKGWEEQLLAEMRHIYKQLIRTSDTDQLVKDWRAHCWKRLNAERGAMQARIDAAVTKLDNHGKREFDVDLEHIYSYKQWANEILEAWKNLISIYVGTPRSISVLLSADSSSTLTRALNSNLEMFFDQFDFDKRAFYPDPVQETEMKCRLQIEIDYIIYRLHQGLKFLEGHNEFWSKSEWQSVFEQRERKEISDAQLFKHDDLYNQQQSLEKKREVLIKTREGWIEDYMEWVGKEIRDNFSFAEGLPLEKGKMKMVNKKNENRLKDKIVDYRAIETGIFLMWEQCVMEHLLIYEVKEWEKQLLTEMRHIYKQLVRSSEIDQLVKDWREKCWKRLNAERGAMQARVDNAVTKLDSHHGKMDKVQHRDHQIPYKHWANKIGEAWGNIMYIYMGTNFISELASGLQSANTSAVQGTLLTPNLESFFDQLNFGESTIFPMYSNFQEMEMKRRLQSELDAIHFRLHQGLENCDELYRNTELVKIKHSPRKWVSLEIDRADLNLHATSALRKAYASLLRMNKNIIFIQFNYSSSSDVKTWITEIIQDMPLLTCVDLCWPETMALTNTHLLVIQGEPTPQKALLAQSESKATVIFIHGTKFKIQEDGLLEHYSDTLQITVSFFGPEIDDLTLRLLHYSESSEFTVKVEESPEFQLPVSFLPTTSDIIVCCSPAKLKTQLPFQKNARNNLTININKLNNDCSTSSYFLRDIQLLDKAQNTYNPRT